MTRVTSQTELMTDSLRWREHSCSRYILIYSTPNKQLHFISPCSCSRGVLAKLVTKITAIYRPDNRRLTSNVRHPPSLLLNREPYHENGRKIESDLLMNKHVLIRIICSAMAFHIGHISLSDIDSQHVSVHNKRA